MLTFIFCSTCCPGVFWVFQFLGRTFQLKVLPFGLKVFPWVFTRVVATLVHCRSSSPVRSSSVLLFGRLASGGGVQGSFGVSSPYDPAVVSGPWVPSELGKVFPSLHRDFRFFLGAHFDIPRLLARPSELKVLALQECFRIFPRVLWRPPSFGRNFSATLPALWSSTQV